MGSYAVKKWFGKKKLPLAISAALLFVFIMYFIM